VKQDGTKRVRDNRGNTKVRAGGAGRQLGGSLALSQD